ncbi:MAG: GGDEF domain-containing protein [Planctomycetota bacterium]|jgi:diguanylate cyclase (GGDEF)-like protein
MSSRQIKPRPGRSRPVHDSGHWLLAAVAGMTAAVLLAATGRFAHLPLLVEATIAVALGLLTMFALAPWKQIAGRARDRQDLRALTRSVRQFDHDHDREPLRTLQTDRGDEIGELSRAIRQALTNATAHRLEAHRLRKSMDHSIRQETHRATGRLQREAQTDPLTGLGNRRALREQLVRLVEEASDQKQVLAALWIDVDHFKKVNDALGHSAGDACLAFLGKLLRSSLRDRDCAFRNGGDEFVVLMPGASGDIGVKVAERIRSLFGQLAWTHARLPRPTISIGVAAVRPAEKDDPRELIRRADEAMYAAKRAGRAQVAAWGDVRDAA